MNIEPHNNKTTFKITQNYVIESYYNYISEVYYDQWGIDERRFPIESNALFLTYRVYDQDKPLEPMLNRFKDFYHYLLKRLRSDKRSAKYVYERQPVGMAAVDYNNSSLGSWVEPNGPHIHSVIVIHPELRPMTVVWLNMLKHHYKGDFYYEKPRKPEHTIRNGISYCLKGIMHADGFYKDRDDLSIQLGPYKQKFQSNVVRVGRVPVLKKPIFKLKERGTKGVSVD